LSFMEVGLQFERNFISAQWILCMRVIKEYLRQKKDSELRYGGQ